MSSGSEEGEDIYYKLNSSLWSNRSAAEFYEEIKNRGTVKEKKTEFYPTGLTRSTADRKQSEREKASIVRALYSSIIWKTRKSMVEITKDYNLSETDIEKVDEGASAEARDTSLSFEEALELDEDVTSVLKLSLKKEIMDNGSTKQRLLPPIWRDFPDPSLADSELFSYLRQMKRFSEKNWITGGDEVLIWQSLAHSNKLHLLNEMPVEATGDVKEFTSWVKTAYGPDSAQLVLTLTNISQQPTEAITSFLYRTVHSYYRARFPDEEIPTDAQLDHEDKRLVRTEIFTICLRGLRNLELRNLMMRRKDLLTMDNFAKTAKKLALTIDAGASVAHVNKVEVTDEKREIQNAMNEITEFKTFLTQWKKGQNEQSSKKGGKGKKNNEKKNNKKNYDKNDSGEKKKIGPCFACNKEGHIMSNCYFNPNSKNYKGTEEFAERFKKKETKSRGRSPTPVRSGWGSE